VLEALILAGGASTRMGEPKALLPDPDGVPFVLRVVQTLTTAGLADIAVVTGPDHDAIVEVLRRDRTAAAVRVVRNPAPERGQLSSLLCGLEAVDSPVVEGVLVTLVDVPMVAVSTVIAVTDAWRSRRAPIVRPAIGDRHGHPVIFDRRVFAALRQAPLEAGAKRVVRDWAREVENVMVEDQGCLVDVDTPDDYKRLRPDA
jgi:molybdenum cofactor cytidylyltransferase